MSVNVSLNRGNVLDGSEDILEEIEACIEEKGSVRVAVVVLSGDTTSDEIYDAIASSDMNADGFLGSLPFGEFAVEREDI